MFKRNRMTRRALMLGTAGALATRGKLWSSQAQISTPIGDHGLKSKPKIGVFGFNVEGMDRSVRPGDDFIRYAVGKWIDATEIPPDRSSWGAVSAIKEENDARVREVIEGAARANATPGSNMCKIGDYFRAFMDEATIERLGIKPLVPELESISRISIRRDLAAVLGMQIRSDVDILNLGQFHTPRILSVWVAEDLDDATKYRPYLIQGGLGMPDREYYLAPSKLYADLRAKYVEHITAMLKLAGLTDPEQRASGVMALEIRIAESHASVSDTIDVTKGNTVWTRSDLEAKAPGLDWKAFLASAGLIDQPRFGAWQPRALAGISKLTDSEPLDVWKNYLSFHAIENAAPFLSKAFADEHFEFNAHAVLGIPQQRERWRRGVDFTSEALGEAVGKLYVERFIPLSAKAQAQEMADNVLKAFARRLDRLKWMGQQTKAEAKKKLSNLRVMVGYPDRWRDYSDLEVTPQDAYGNWWRAELFNYRRNLAKLGRPVDRQEWFMTPQTVNALYAPSQNSVTLPAAILTPTFFDPGADSAVNYGALGAGLGHEVTHGFDTDGALFDAGGNLRNWWNKADLDHFQAEAKRLAVQYSAYEPLSGLQINGEQTSTEDIADLGGLATAWDAYQLSLRGRPAPVIHGFTSAQRFFLGFAQNFRAKYREEALRKQILTDILPPTPYRALTVRNFDNWYSAFDIKPSDKLYVAPADRVRIW